MAMAARSDTEILMEVAFTLEQATQQLKALETAAKVTAATITKEGKARIDLQVEHNQKKVETLWHSTQELLELISKFKVTKLNVFPESMLKEAKRITDGVGRELSRMKERIEKAEIKWPLDVNGFLNKVDTMARGAERRFDKLKDKAERDAISPVLKAGPFLDSYEKMEQEAARKIEKMREESERKGVKIIADAGPALKSFDEMDRHAAKLMDNLRQKIAKNPLAGLSADAAKEAAKLLKEFSGIESRYKNAVERMNIESRRASFDPMSAQAIRLRETVRLMAEQIVNFVGRIPPHLQNLGDGFQRITSTAATARQQLSALSTAMPEVPTRSFTEAITSAAGAIRVFLGSVVAHRLYDFAKGAFEASTKMETLRTTLGAMLESNAEASQSINNLKAVASDLGLSFETLAETYTKFTVAASQAGLELEASRAIFDSVAVAAGALRLEGPQLEHVFLALEQMLSKGVIAAEELRRQLGNVLPGAFSIMAQANSVTTQELEKMMRTSGLITNEVLPKFAKQLLKVFGPGAIAQAQTARAEMERLKNEFFFMEQAVGDKLVPELKEMMTVLKDAGKDGKSAFDSLGDAFAKVADRITGVMNIIRDLTSGDIVQMLRGTFLEVSAVAIEAFAQVQSGLLGLMSSFLKYLLPDEMFAKFQEFAEFTRESLRDQAEGLKIAAAEARAGYENLAETNNRISGEVEARIDAMRKALDKTILDTITKAKTGVSNLGDLGKEAAKAVASIGDSFGLVNDKMVENSYNILQAIALREKQGDISEEVGAIIRDELEKELEVWERSGQEIPAALRERAELYQALGTKQRELREETEKLIAAWEGESVAVAKKTEVLLASIAAAERDGFISVEASEKIKKAIQEQLDAYVNLGEVAPEALQKVADRYDVIAASAEKSKKALEDLVAAAKAVDDAYAELRSAEEEYQNSPPAENRATQELRRRIDELNKMQREGALTAEQIAEKFSLEDQLNQARAMRKTEEEKQRIYEEEEKSFGKLQAAREKVQQAEEKALAAAREQLRLSKQNAAVLDYDLQSQEESVDNARELADFQRQVIEQRVTAGTLSRAEADAQLAVVDAQLKTNTAQAEGMASAQELADATGETAENAESAADSFSDLVKEAEKVVKSMDELNATGDGLDPLIRQHMVVLRLAPLVAQALSNIGVVAASIRMGG